ncbi:ESX secretion-associated protein EspG [Prauserella halophila]|uniref:ESX secretion-associated protein EspG n=1 Tax=Prauserella halophila TaxID=185641 RepID=A0ABN1WHH7_9PSEU|nr:ESX secretion-associated protein EspG [Prauserella halophila]MCP2236742.1 EspG family protein [Prauserella halophila]
MAVLDRPVTLPRVIALYAWELEELGEAHPILGARETYIHVDRTGEAERQALGLLQDLGLSDGQMPTRELRVALRVLRSPVRELYSHSKIHTRDGGTLEFKSAAAVAGDVGVALEVRGDMVTLSRFDADDLVDGFLSELPALRPAQIPELHTTRRDYELRDENHDMFAARESPEKRIEKLVKAPRLGVHQVFVAGRTTGGGHERSLPFTLIDARDQGRILTFTDPGGGIHCLPADSGTLTKTFLATWQSIP